MAEVTTVMLVGVCGAGKSTLGNVMLFGTPDPVVGFRSAAGGEPVTTTCQTLQDDSRQGSLFKVIDTPGIPDPKQNTKLYFNRIVQEARKAGSLNAVVFVMNCSVNRNDVKRSFRNAAVLLEEFNKLGCTIVITCRVPDLLRGTNEHDRRTAQQTWTDFATEVANEAGIQYFSIYLLDGDFVSTADHIRQVLTKCRAVPVTRDGGMSTFAELKRSAENRRDDHTRGVQLEQDIERLRNDNRGLHNTVANLEAAIDSVSRLGGPLQTLSHGLVGFAVSTGIIVESTAAVVLSGSVGLVVAGVAAVGREAILHLISRNKASIENNEKAVVAMEAEARSGVVDVERLRRDEETLQRLNDLDG